MDDDARPSRTPQRRQGARVPTAWFVGLALLIAAPALTGDPAVSLVFAGFYLIVTAAWALLRRRTSRGAIGWRGLTGVIGIGFVVVLAGGAVAGPAEVAAPPASEAEFAPTDAPSASDTDTDTDIRLPEPAAPTAAVEEAPSSTPEPTTERAPVATDPNTALEVALHLEVKGRAPRTGYDRDLFGSGWVDTDRNGCDTRNDILARDLTGIVHRPGTQDCVVASGVLADPYSGQTIHFLRGNDTSRAVQIDHVVALSDAWQKGAQQWDADTRVRFGNDPLNLLAVDGPLNMQKGDGDTATWLPPNRSYRCEYVARQVAVKDGYGLWVTEAEQDAMVRVLSDCPDQLLPGLGDA